VIGPRFIHLAMLHPNRNVYKERMRDGRLHIIGSQRKLRHTHTLILAHVGFFSISFNLLALTTRDNKGETPLDIARRSGACAEIIGLLSLTPEAARSLGFKGMARLYAPVAYWNDEMAGWIESRSWQTVTNSSISTMTSWCVKCSNSANPSSRGCWK